MQILSKGNVENLFRISNLHLARIAIVLLTSRIADVKSVW